MYRKLGYLGGKEGGSREAVQEACLEEARLSQALQVGWAEWGRQAVGVTAMGEGDGRTSAPHPRQAPSRGFLGC